MWWKIIKIFKKIYCNACGYVLPLNTKFKKKLKFIIFSKLVLNEKFLIIKHILHFKY